MSVDVVLVVVVILINPVMNQSILILLSLPKGSFREPWLSVLLQSGQVGL